MRINSIPNKTKAALFFVAVLGVTGCSKSPAPATGPAATVTLKDGTQFSGNVTKSDASTITLQATGGESRTYPMSQVSTVQYGDAGSPSAGTVAPAPMQPNSAPVQPNASFTQANPAPPPPVQSSRAPTPRPLETRRFEPAPVEAVVRTIPSGTTLRIRNNEAIESQSAETGQTYSGVVAEDVVDTEGRVAIPRGSNATLVIRGARDQGKVQGRSELVLDVGSVSVGGRSYRLETQDLVEQGREGVGTNKRTAIFTGGGGALGGIIGALAGGGKGAAIGALSGVAAGAGTQAVTRGKGVRVPAETMLSFRLEAPVRIRETR